MAKFVSVINPAVRRRTVSFDFFGFLPASESVHRYTKYFGGLTN